MTAEIITLRPAERCFWDDCDQPMADGLEPFCEDHYSEAMDLAEQGLIELREQGQ